ncbi:MAG TPA: hypothetical protein VFB72_00655 [Verrucomicrobiae bacterium]|nr:hypothetical protein [Verrucomicrobiae bacterium]
MKARLVLACIFCFLLKIHAAEIYPERWVWIFGWGLNKDSDVTDISHVIETGAKHGLNGAVLAAGIDTMSLKTPEYFRGLDAIKQICESNHVELIPAGFSIGYGSCFLAHNPNLAEGLPVEDAPFVVRDGVGRLVPDETVRLKNGGFEDFNGNNLKGFNFHDQPGEISFADREIKHSGTASLRLEHFTANPYGHGRVMQEIKVHPHRCYRVTIWVKTEGFQPTGAFRLLALAPHDRDLAPREYNLPSTTDWRQLTMMFNSMTNAKVLLYAGVWDGKAGKIWLDDWRVEEIGPVNVLHRPGTPVTVRSEDGATTYAEGKDYAPLMDPHLQPWREDGDALPLKIIPSGRIHNGDRLRVSWYHSQNINDGQVTVCMAEPEVYEIMGQEMKVVADRLHPKKFLLGMDEVRMGGTCRACAGRNMGELLGECVTKQMQIIRKYLPDEKIYVWSDMFDPNHNAHGNYYLVNGDFTGSWEHVPKDLVMAVWGGAPREKSLQFFEQQGFPVLVACYYDADNLNDVKGWLQIVRPMSNVQGFMYTPWTRKYGLLPAFGDLLSGQR